MKNTAEAKLLVTAARLFLNANRDRAKELMQQLRSPTTKTISVKAYVKKIKKEEQIRNYRNKLELDYRSKLNSE